MRRWADTGRAGCAADTPRLGDGYWECNVPSVLHEAGRPNQFDLFRQMAKLAADQEHLLLRTRQRLYALEATEALRAAGRPPRDRIEFVSQYGEDLLLFDLLGHEPRGMIIEAGAFDGKHYSVSNAFDAMGWTTLLIEPIPEMAERARRNRANARVEACALAAPNSPGSITLSVTGDALGGMLSHVQMTETQRKMVEYHKASVTPITVAARTLSDLLGSQSGPIDALILDVEGYEIAALQGLNFNVHAPRIMLIEDNSRREESELSTFMQRLPYTQVGWLQVNRIYIHQQAGNELTRARALRSALTPD
jgi:FkbM family methyltransferase